jgi:hypothetical protein
MQPNIGDSFVQRARTDNHRGINAFPGRAYKFRVAADWNQTFADFPSSL